MVIIKLWSGNRMKKVTLCVSDKSDGLINEIIKKGSEKMEINGEHIVLNSDGSLIDENEVLLHFKNEIFQLLELNEIWVPEVLLNFSQNHIESTEAVQHVTLSNNMICNTSEPSIVLPPIQIENKSTNFEFMWESFCVPWNEIPAHIRQEFENGNRNNQSITTLIHIVVDRMRELKKIIPSFAFKIVARKIAEQYEKVFRDKDEEGLVIGSGFATVYNKLLDRNNYLNRPHKRGQKAVDANPVKNKKNLLSARAGCSNWDPDVFASREEPERPNNFLNVEEIFADQRNFINTNKPSLGQIKEQFVNFINLDNIKLHFKLLTQCDLDLRLSSFIKENYDRIFKLGEGMKMRLDRTVAVSEDSKLIQIITIFAKYFKEDVEYFLDVKSNSTGIVKAVNDIKTPFIIKQNGKFYVSMDNELTCSNGYEIFLDAFKISYALYFILNAKFPNGLTITFEMMQRYIFKMYPDAGSKSRKAGSSKQKAINLIRKLSKL